MHTDEPLEQPESKSIWSTVIVIIVFLTCAFFLLAVLSSLLYAWSDIRLKRNILLRGQSNSGLNIYEYNYIWSQKKYRGTMAQELLDTHPEAIVKLFGFYLVDYSKLDVDFEKI